MPSGCAVPGGSVANCVAGLRFHAVAGNANDPRSTAHSIIAKRVNCMVGSPFSIGAREEGWEEIDGCAGLADTVDRRPRAVNRELQGRTLNPVSWAASSAR